MAPQTRSALSTAAVVVGWAFLSAGIVWWSAVAYSHIQENGDLSKQNAIDLRVRDARFVEIEKSLARIEVNIEYLRKASDKYVRE